jgi:peptide deformylase
MAILSILHYPDPRLKKTAKPVDVIDDRVRHIVADMMETMAAAGGIGLAANQVNIQERIIVTDLSGHGAAKMVFINPKILKKEGKILWTEGCLSVPEYRDEVERAAYIEVQAFDEYGNPFSLGAFDLLAVCLQHEIDHLDGKLFIEKLSTLKQKRLRDKLAKVDKKKEKRACA